MDVVTKTKMHFRKEQWKKFIQNREASGLSVAAWCKQNGVAQARILNGFTASVWIYVKICRRHKLLRLFLS